MSKDNENQPIVLDIYSEQRGKIRTLTVALYLSLVINIILAIAISAVTFF